LPARHWALQKIFEDAYLVALRRRD